MNDMISGMTQNQEAQDSSAYVDYRLRAIATNAVREARIAYGRDAGQWIDDDIRRLELIFHYLHITPAHEIDVSTESYPLVSTVQAPKDNLLDEADKIVRRRKSRKDEVKSLSSIGTGAIAAALNQQETL